MDSSVQNVRRSKEEKKIIKRQIKAAHTLLKHEGIHTVSQPTQYLVVSNAGLMNGVSRELLLNLLTKAGTVESLLMPPNKPYSYVAYASVEDGQRAHALFNGHVLRFDGNDVKIYCSYVQRVDLGVSVCSSVPPGLCVLVDFVSEEEEALLLQAVDWTLPDEAAQRELKHRRVKHYGYEFRYDNNNVDKDKPLPGGLPSVCDAVLHRCVCEGHIDVLTDQLTINQYESGQGIPPHVDTHSAFEDTILSLSLGARTVMDFRHPDGRSVAVVLPQRSLLVMKGESRYLWTHGITPRKFDVIPAEGMGVVSQDPRNLTLNRRCTRTSFTFRKVRHTPCNCAYPFLCDTQCPPSPPRLPVARSDACRLEEQYVHSVYEEISSHFSSTRHSPWPRVRDFLLSLPYHALIADIGCGNGKYLGINPRAFTMGCDRSLNLAWICTDRGFSSFVCDALSVPLRSSGFDAVISIAVIHHFSTQERRLAAVTELVRLLKVGGQALIYVWAMEQEFRNEKSKYLKNTKNQAENQDNMEADASITPHIRTVEPDEPVKQSGVMLERKHRVEDSPPKLSVHTNRTAFASQDLLVPWHLKGEAKVSQDAVFHRFYHVFQQGELETLCESVKGVKVQQSYYDQGNWCVVLQKDTETDFELD